jgi:hypothetical protein
MKRKKEEKKGERERKKVTKCINDDLNLNKERNFSTGFRSKKIIKTTDVNY